jgi:hypothetical protein
MIQYKQSQKLKKLQLEKNFAEANWEEIEAECKLIDSENLALHKEKSQELQNHIKAIESICNLTKAQSKYLNGFYTPVIYTREVDTLQRIKSNYEGIIKEKEKQEMLAKQQAYQANLQQNAIIFLLENGKVLGQDFTVENAINSANQFKFEQLIKEKLESSSEFYFNGENCDEDCGWDGVSRRCFCGNRRVAWEYNGNFDNMDIYAEAY